MNLKKILWWIFLPVIIIFSFIFMHKIKHEKPTEHIPTLAVGHPWIEPVDLKEEYVAQIKAVQHIELRSYEKGYLQKIYVDEGQKVNEGQKMFQLVPFIMQAEYDKAKAEYHITELEYQNTKSLQAKNVVSANELALAKAKLDKSKAVMNLAKTHLDFTLIKAPFSGIMDKFEVRLGSLVDEGELLTSLSDNSQVWVYFNVSEYDYLEYMSNKKDNKKRKLEMLLANGMLFPHKGKIDTIEADFNNETGNIAFRASFPNPDGVLRHGQTANVILKEKIKDALVIPQKSAYEILNKKYVFVVDESGIISSRYIKIAHEIPHLFVIESGLNTKDTVLLEGVSRVHSGQKIHTQLENIETIKQSLELPVK